MTYHRMSAAVATFLISAGLVAQGASRNYILASSERADGALANSTTYQLVGAFGGGIVAVPAQSTTYILAGGYAATLDTGTTGRPWLMDVSPPFATPKSRTTLTLYGTELNLGSRVTVKVDGTDAKVLTRSQDQITVTLPFVASPSSRPRPGFQSVSVSNGTATSTLPNAIGILPMLYTSRAPGPMVGFNLVMKGSRGDRAILAVSPIRKSPWIIPGFLHGFELDPTVMLPLFFGTISASSGELHMPIPPFPWVGPVYVQAMFASNNPGYAPGSFTNVLTFR